MKVSEQAKIILIFSALLMTFYPMLNMEHIIALKTVSLVQTGFILYCIFRNG